MPMGFRPVLDQKDKRWPHLPQHQKEPTHCNWLCAQDWTRLTISSRFGSTIMDLIGI